MSKPVHTQGDVQSPSSTQRLPFQITTHSPAQVTLPDDPLADDPLPLDWLDDGLDDPLDPDDPELLGEPLDPDDTLLLPELAELPDDGR